jgi:hypothetical protein
MFNEEHEWVAQTKTVKEVIETLSNYDPALPVLVTQTSGRLNEYCPISITLDDLSNQNTDGDPWLAGSGPCVLLTG